MKVLVLFGIVCILSWTFVAQAQLESTPKASVVDLTVRINKPPTYDQIKQKIREAAKGPLQSILDYTEEELFPFDFASDIHLPIFDAKAGIQLSDNFVTAVVDMALDAVLGHRKRRMQ